MTGPTIVVNGALTFNGDDHDFRCTGLDGWYGAAAPRAELTPNGATAGAFAIGPWDDNEAYYTMTGTIRAADRATLMERRRQLLNATPATEEWPLLVRANGEDVDLTAYVRRYDRPDIGLVGARNLVYTIPLVAPDPLRYGASVHDGQPFGVYNGDIWFTTFVDDAGTYDRLADLSGANPSFLFQQQDAADSLYPLGLVLNSPGDKGSRRLTFEVTGPLTQGDWRLTSDTGDEMWADLGLLAGQTVIFDCYEQTVTLDGTSIDHLMFGDFLTLEPGSNTYRLVTGSYSEGFAVATRAEPAYS